METASVLTRKQVKTYGPRPIAGWGDRAQIKAEVRYDDECGNGHNTFSITADIYIPGRRDGEAGGCLHEEVARVFPELAPFIKWHLVSSDMPLHYIANTVYHAGNRDHWGLLKGEPHSFDTAIFFGRNPIKHRFAREQKFVKFLQETAPYDFEVIRIDHDPTKDGYKFDPKYTFGGYADKWHECPFDSEGEALDFLYALQHCDPQFVTVAVSWGEGKERDFAAARSSAVWPEATDEELSLPKEELTAKLLARRDGMMREFRQAVESLGFVY